MSGEGSPLVMVFQFSWNSWSFQTFAKASFKVLPDPAEYWVVKQKPEGIAGN